MFSEGCPSDEKDDEDSLVYHMAGCSQMSVWRWGGGGSRVGWAAGTEREKEKESAHVCEQDRIRESQFSGVRWRMEPQRHQGANEPPATPAEICNRELTTHIQGPWEAVNLRTGITPKPSLNTLLYFNWDVYWSSSFKLQEEAKSVWS